MKSPKWWLKPDCLICSTDLLSLSRPFLLFFNNWSVWPPRAKCSWERHIYSRQQGSAEPLKPCLQTIKRKTGNVIKMLKALIGGRQMSLNHWAEEEAIVNTSRAVPAWKAFGVDGWTWSPCASALLPRSVTVPHAYFLRIEFSSLHGGLLPYCL